MIQYKVMQCNMHKKQITHLEYKNEGQKSKIYCSDCNILQKKQFIVQFSQQSLLKRIQLYELHLKILLKQIMLIFNQFKNQLFNNFDSTFNLIQVLKQNTSPEIKQLKLQQFNLTFSPELILSSNHNLLTEKFSEKISKIFKSSPQIQNVQPKSGVHKQMNLQKIYIQNASLNQEKNNQQIEQMIMAQNQSLLKIEPTNCCFY